MRTPPTRAPAPAGRGPVAVALLVGLACAAVVVATAAVEPGAAPLTASFVVAVSGLAGGALVLARRGPRAARSCRRWFALTAIAWCGGELVSALVDVVLAGPPPRPNVGDALSLCAGPLALLGVLALPRPTGRGGALRTLAVDAVVLALGLAVAVWMTVFPVGGPPLLVLFCVGVLLLYLLLCSLIAQVAMVGRDPGVLVVLVGLVTLAVGDLAVTRELVAGAAVWDWRLAAVQCLVWPVILGGVDGIGRGRPLGRCGATTDEGETYATVVTTAAVYVVWLVALAAFATTGAGSSVAAVLGVLAIASAGLREVLRLRARVAVLRRLSQESRHDPLTGLGNARALAERLAPVTEGGAPASLVLLDLDGFGEVDERLGRTASDVLLARVAEGLADRFGEPRTHRTGGDELVLLCACGPEAAQAVAEEARALVATTSAAAGVRLVASAGVSGVDAGASTAVPRPLELLAEAATAVSAAKRAGGDRTALFRGEVAERVRRRALVERRLRSALAAADLHVELQPVVHLSSGRLRGFEVLSRWQDDVLGGVRPDEFVEVAEASGLVSGVGLSALRGGLAAFAAAGAAERGLTLSVNASPVELRDPGYPAQVAAELAAAGVPASALVVEVTESVLVAEQDPALASMAALRAAGCRIAVDDVGSGYASLTYLARLPVDVVKVDRSLVVALDEPRTARVLDALVSLSRSLGLVVLAEGVEEDWQVDPLVRAGATLGQGWLWWPALPARDVPALVRADAVAHPGPPPLEVLGRPAALPAADVPAAPDPEAAAPEAARRETGADGPGLPAQRVADRVRGGAAPR
ncbi:bifunctional diguanylate cyclase/phosphodiesterase [uncultured Pseudokineococcus sp.]|uniref:bifunctional diguanylate cyclase/phosphodiesterase n=1 Tax=uncultured Pseudokineococcus sp. TaxID=1642928 RepID=UPI002621A04C|nr:bifunctional diguanylate cyclase/phosphodiesterase [uncultured Pseudokineococcus sp.]